MVLHSFDRGRSEEMPSRSASGRPQPHDPVEALADALAAHDRACRLLFMELDYTQHTYNYTIPTSVLIHLDAARETAAMMFSLLPDPAPPIQPPEPSPISQAALAAFFDGLLTLDELAGLLNISIVQTREIVSPRVFAKAIVKFAAHLED